MSHFANENNNKPARSVKYLGEFKLFFSFFLFFQVDFNDKLYLAPLTTVSAADLSILQFISRKPLIKYIFKCLI